MATLPPWLDRPNYVSAMQAGAQLGLSMRAQDQAAEQAAIRNQLEQDALNVQQTRYAAQAAEALRAHNVLEAYRQRQLEQRRAESEALAESRRQALEQRALGKEYGEVETTQLSPNVSAAFRKGSPGLHVFKTGDTTSSTTPSLTQRTQLDIAKQEISDANREVASILKEPSYGPTDPQAEERQKRIDELKGKISNLRSNMLEVASQPAGQRLLATNAPVATPLPISTPTNAAPASYAGAEFIRVRSKSGKVGRVPASELEQALKEGYTLIE